MMRVLARYAVIASLVFPSQAWSDPVLLQGLDTDIMTQNITCQIRGNVLSIDNYAGEDRIYERYVLTGEKGNLTAVRIDGSLGQSVIKFVGIRGSIGWRPPSMLGPVIWGEVTSYPVRLSFYDKSSSSLAYLPQFSNELGQNAAGESGTAFFSNPRYDGTRVFSVGDRAVIFTSGTAEQGINSQVRTLSGYSLYFMSVDFEARTYAFDRHSEIGNTAIEIGAEQEIGAHTSQPDDDNMFFIVTSESVSGSDLFEYTITRYEISESGLLFRGAHEFSGDFGHVKNDSLVWQSEDISLFRTYLGGVGDERRSMFHAFDWGDGTLLGSVDSARIGAPIYGNLQAIEMNGDQKAVFYATGYVFNPEGPDDVWDEMTSIRYDQGSNSFATDLEIERMKNCLSGSVQYYLRERDGSVFLEDFTRNDYEIDETQYEIIEDIDHLTSSTIPTCFDGQVDYHKTRNASSNQTIFRGIISFPRVCEIERYRVQNSLNEGNVADACDIFGWCHLVTRSFPVKVETLEGMRDGVWRPLR